MFIGSLYFVISKSISNKKFIVLPLIFFFHNDLFNMYQMQIEFSISIIIGWKFGLKEQTNNEIFLYIKYCKILNIIISFF